jgi:hypothetical protein
MTRYHFDALSGQLLRKGVDAVVYYGREHVATYVK